MCEIKKIRFHFKTHTLIFTIFLLFFLTDLVYGGLKYYYLHVSSFQAEKRAIQFAQNLQKIGLQTVIRGEEITDKGFWYRIYIGPFYSRLEAELESRELKRKGIIDYAAIHKKDSLLSSNLEKMPEPIEKIVKAEPEKVVSEIISTPKDVAGISKPPSETPQIEKKPSITELPPDKIPSKTEGIAAEKAPTPLKAQKPVEEPYPKIPLKFLKKGYGRNTRQWGLALCLKHTYRDIQTTVIKRRTVNDPNYALEEDKKDEFPTQMHMTTLQFLIGLTNYLEIFGNIGTSFDDPSELGFAYGGGLRLNLFEIKGFYSALKGEYLSGDFEEEYISDQNNKWQKETEWEEITAKVELGFIRSRFSAYIGGTYFHYDEDTKRQQLEGVLPLDIIQDKIEEENSFGAYGGIAIHFTPALIANLEGEVFRQKSISLALEILF